MVAGGEGGGGGEGILDIKSVSSLKYDYTSGKIIMLLF